MNAYYQVNLKDFIDELGEEDVKPILFSFSSPFNQDIETFLREKAIEFSRQRLAATYLVFTKFKDNMEGLMLEILISLCQTGAEIYGFALGLIGIGIGTVVGVAIVVAKEEVSRK